MRVLKASLERQNSQIEELTEDSIKKEAQVRIRQPVGRPGRCTFFLLWRGLTAGLVNQPGKTVTHHPSYSVFSRSVSLNVCVGNAACTWVSQSGVRGMVGAHVCCLGAVCVCVL